MPPRRHSSSVRQRPPRRTPPPGKDRNAIILFVDIVGCSEISNHLKLEDYNTFITDFQKCFIDICEFYKKATYDEHEYVLYQAETRGDEGCLKIFVSKKNDSLARDIDVAISIALDLKRMWLFTNYNKGRIMEGLLPADLAIGIHFGKVYVKDMKAVGYTINLAKRIESKSREGNFTHILLSESAHGQLYYLKDERIYKFDRPHIIETKGISHTIKAVEIKHHFLPTDWQDTTYDEPSDISMVFGKYEVDEVLKVIREAYEINPTNLWLAEEYIYLSILGAYRKLKDKGMEDDLDVKKKEYAPVGNIAQRIARSVLRDATLLSICGQILGEMGEYAEEEKKYREAIARDDSDGDFHWYLGLCISYQLDIAFRKNKIELDKFYDGNCQRIKEVLKEYMKAIDLNPMNPWMVYDYACELSWWSQVKKDFNKTAVEKLIDVLKLDSDLKYWVKEEEYLKPIINDPKVKKFLD